MENKKEKNIICPFCKEKDFDLIGLKSHLQNDCEQYRKIETLKIIRM